MLLLFSLAILPTMTHYAENLRNNVVAEHMYTLKAPLELDGTLPPAARDTLHFARDTAGTLLRKAAEHVREAKRIHDELEALCRPYVDFAAADALTERTLHELFPA